jgi:hypothetical protein
MVISFFQRFFPAQQQPRGKNWPSAEQWDRIKVISYDLHSALLGEITPNIRGVAFSCNSEHIRVRFIFDGPLSNQDEDTVDTVDARFSTYTYDNGWDGTFATETLRLDYPEDVTPFQLDAWAYRRYEEIREPTQPDGADQLPLPQGWELVADAGTSFSLTRELGRETGNEQHVLRNQIQGFAIARSVSSDDVLFSFSDGRVAVVHLTWSGRAETNSIWPYTRTFDSIVEFRQAAASEPSDN